MFVFQTLMHEILSVTNVAAGRSGDNYLEGTLYTAVEFNL